MHLDTHRFLKKGAIILNFLPNFHLKSCMSMINKDFLFIGAIQTREM